MQTHTPFISHYRHAAVRNLAWCLQSPPLLQPQAAASCTLFPLPQASNDTLQWLAQLDQAPSPLIHHLQQQHSGRLGLYYEALWQFYFSQGPHWQLLSHNQQIHQQGKTLGAFDFLCRQQQTYWHIEAAVKFYLYYPGREQTDAEPAALTQWLGPNTQDSLARKLQHMQQQQLPLSAAQSDNPGFHWLTRHYPEAREWRAALLMQGYLFYPWMTPRTNNPQINPAHLAGYWLHWRQLPQLLQAQNAANPCESHWRWLHKTEWLARWQGDYGEDARVLSTRALQQHKAPEQAILLVRLHRIENTWCECERYMLVADNWPAAY